MRIEKLETWAVRVPLKDRILTPYGSRLSVSRTILRLTTDSGLAGYGEVHGRVTPAAVMTFESTVVGKSPWRITEITQAIRNWSYYPYQKPQPLMGAIEIACLDLQAKASDVPMYELLGGKVRSKLPVAVEIYYCHGDENKIGQVHSVEEVVGYARRFVDEYGFNSLKLKAGYFSPKHDLEAMEALRDTFGRHVRLRIDPQGAWSPVTAIRAGQVLARIGVEYFEDPCWGIAAMAQVKKNVSLPIATNMCVTNFDELGPAIAMQATDIVLSDPWYWGGVRATLALDTACAALGLDIGMHSGSELAVGWAAMIHTAAAMPHLTLPIDCMNVCIADDIMVGGRLNVVDGEIAPPEAPGLGLDIDENKLEQFSQLSLSNDLSDRLLDPSLADLERPGWYPQMPAW